MEVYVIPFEVGGFVGPGQTIIPAEGAVPQLDTVQLDASHGPEFLHNEGQLENYRSLLDQMREAALGVEASRELIRSVAGKL
ncbi:Scr1 family TA system antitoxin-like transcriptional regulator [Streptomyces spiramyceticus]|uniref:Scr1 family TA system antitoxin-like transcriptional regulator n=1 Tax=Streptomyces spiramyceticus TaxID=299717 RepID=UPI00237BB3AE|nr:Scr1 family TA system antitoxin-like transcriptional regulator [Streptomyces spiramyceticus]